MLHDLDSADAFSDAYRWQAESSTMITMRRGSGRSATSWASLPDPAVHLAALIEAIPELGLTQIRRGSASSSLLSITLASIRLTASDR